MYTYTKILALASDTLFFRNSMSLLIRDTDHEKLMDLLGSAIHTYKELPAEELTHILLIFERIFLFEHEPYYRQLFKDLCAAPAHQAPIYRFIQKSQLLTADMRSILIALLNRHARPAYPQPVNGPRTSDSTFSVTSKDPYNYALPFKQWYGDLYEIIQKDQRSGFYALPSKIELHPGPTCNYHCEYCIGQGFQTGTVQYAPHRVMELIETTAPFISQYIFSGQFTETFTARNVSLLIKRALSQNRPAGIYTNGYFLGDKAAETLATPGIPNGSYFTFNLSAVSELTYRRLYRPAPAVTNAANVVRENITYLDRLNHHVAQDGFRLNFTYHVRAVNGSREELLAMIEWVASLRSPRILRFTMPLPPLRSVHTTTAARFRGTDQELFARGRSIIEAARKDHEQEDFKIVVMPPPKVHPGRPAFDHCHAMINSFVMAPSGDIYPCCYTANPSFRDMIIGNINAQNFWEIWYGEKRKERFEHLVPKKDCDICSRNDQAINMLFGR